MSSLLPRLAERFADEVLAHLGEYDQLGTSRGRETPRAVLAESMATALIASEKPLATAPVLAEFRRLLVETLLADLPFKNAEFGDVYGKGRDPEQWRRDLEWLRSKPYREASADYDVDPHTGLLMAKAGLPTMLFPIKSRVRIEMHYTHGCPEGEPVALACAFGYGAPFRFHHPLEDGRWLITRLHLVGDDRLAILELAASGVSCRAWQVTT